MTRGFYRDTVVRQRPAFVDDGHGNVEPDWDDVDELSIPGCRVQPLSSEEIVAFRESGVTVTKRLLAPLDSDILPTDRVVFGVAYDVGGDAQGFRSPKGSADHDEILLRRADG